MINDEALHTYLQQEQFENLVTLDITAIGNQGEHLQAWALQFQMQSEDKMYAQVKHLIHQLTIAQMPDETRLQLLYEVAKVSQILLSKLRMQYCNQTGLLNAGQHSALDKVLSIYYISIRLYYSVWQRLSAQLEVEEQKTSLAFFRRFSKPVTTPQDLVKRCIYSIMVLLKQALFEKQLGYRNDTQVVWLYLHACYSFARSYGWEHYSFDLSDLFNYVGKIDIQSIYYQCLLMDIAEPSTYRRHDLLRYHLGLVDWIKYIHVTTDPDDKPFLFVNLSSDIGVQAIDPNISYNPFSPNVPSLFIDITPLIERATFAIEYDPTTMQDSPAVQKERLICQRLSRLALPNLYKKIKPPVVFEKAHEPYQITIGFHAIHYLLSGKSSLANLIHSHLLPEPLRPMINTETGFTKPMSILLTGTYQKQRQMAWQAALPTEEKHLTGNRLPQASLVNQFQVNSLVAMLHDDTHNNRHAKKIWQLGQVQSLKQYLPSETKNNLTKTLNQRVHDHQLPQRSVTAIDTTQIVVKMLGEGIVPCGVRIINPESRLPRFMPALIIPKNPDQHDSQTSLMMARFGYHVNDKLVIRIDSKEVKIRLTALLEITDDIENYTFVRI